MWHSSPEFIDIAAEAVAEVNPVGLPADPVERCVVATPVCAERQGSDLLLGVVGIVDAHERCP